MIHYKYDDNWDQPLRQSAADVLLNNADVAQYVLEKVVSSFDQDLSLYGMFIAAMHNKIPNPFVTTKNYCIKIARCDHAGDVTGTISPIFHIGNDNVDAATIKDTDAIIELTSDFIMPDGFETNEDDDRFVQFGIDAAEAFPEQKQLYNHPFEIDISVSRRSGRAKLLGMVSCCGQSMARVFELDEVGLMNKADQPEPLQLM